MKNKCLVFALGLVAAFQVGCASKGFHREALSEQMGVENPKFDDADIKAEFAKKPNLPKPFKIGVYFKTPHGYSQAWRWTEQDKALLDEISTDLKSESPGSEVFPILSSMVTSQDMKSLRLVAAKHHADAVLIIAGAAEIDRYINNWGWSYLVLAPVLFVPGSEVDTLFVANATLWDTRNEFLYLTAEAEATTHKTYILAFGDANKVLIEEAKTKALANLKVELKKMIQGKKF